MGGKGGYICERWDEPNVGPRLRLNLGSPCLVFHYNVGHGLTVGNAFLRHAATPAVGFLHDCKRFLQVIKNLRHKKKELTQLHDTK